MLSARRKGPYKSNRNLTPNNLSIRPARIHTSVSIKCNTVMYTYTGGNRATVSKLLHCVRNVLRRLRYGTSASRPLPPSEKNLTMLPPHPPQLISNWPNFTSIFFLNPSHSRVRATYPTDYYPQTYFGSPPSPFLLPTFVGWFPIQSGDVDDENTPNRTI